MPRPGTIFKPAIDVSHQVLSALERFKLKGSGTKYRATSPFRPDSDSRSLTISVDPDFGGGGKWFDQVSKEGGNFIELARHLGIALPNQAEATPTKRSYSNLHEYAEAHHVPSEVFTEAGWRQGPFFCPQNGRERPALIFKTRTGPRARFIDGLKPPYMSPAKYQRCWYGLDEALVLIEARDQPLVVCNGEPSVLVAQHYGVAAICVTGGGENGIPAELLDELHQEYSGAILIALDCDKTGRTTSRKMYDALHAASFEARAVDLNGGNGFDLADFCGLHQHDSQTALAGLPDLVEVVQDEGEGETWPYLIKDGCICLQRPPKDGEEQPPQKLCNFTALIVAEKALDDGDTQEELYTIRATCGDRTREFDMLREEFEGEGALNKIKAKLGARARIYPWANMRMLMDAIKALSVEVEDRTTYTHTGWRGDRFLMGNGYVDKDGWHAEPVTDLPGRVHPEHYNLTVGARPPYAPTRTGELAQASACFDELLTLVPPSVMVPLLGAVLLGPLLPRLGAKPPAMHLIGKTGSLKTSVSAVCLSLLGGGFIDAPTDTWRSTMNSIEMRGYHYKNVPFLLDDYKKAAVEQKKVTGLLQNYGDGTGRGRLNDKSQMRGMKPFRGILISTGEDRPEGESSVLSRMLMVRMERAMVDVPLLTRLQEEAPGRLHALAVAWLAWLTTADTSGDLVRFKQVRSDLMTALGRATGGNPGRVASNVACLVASWESFCRCMVELGLWSDEWATMWLQTCHTELYTLSRLQIKLTASERYSELFLSTIRSLLASAKCVLVQMNGGKQEITSGQLPIGGADRDGVYLETKAAWGAALDQLKREGLDPQFSKDAVAAMLEEDGLIVSRYKNTRMVKRRINGVLADVWHLPADIFERDEFTEATDED